MRRRRQQGLTLIHMVAVISLLVVFLGVSGQLTMAVYHVNTQTVRADWATSHLDHALREMRKDVWASGEIRVVEPTRMELAWLDQSVAWSFELDANDAFPEGGRLTRRVFDAGGEVLDERVFELPMAVAFGETRGAGVRVGIEQDEVWLISQVISANQKGATR